MNIPEAIREAMRLANIPTQQALSFAIFAQCGARVTQSAISQYLSGGMTPDRKTLGRIWRACGVAAVDIDEGIELRPLAEMRRLFLGKG